MEWVAQVLYTDEERGPMFCSQEQLEIDFLRFLRAAADPKVVRIDMLRSDKSMVIWERVES